MFKGKVFFWLFFCRLDGVFAGTDEVKSVSVMEGDSVSLNSSLPEIQRGELKSVMEGDSVSLNSSLTEIQRGEEIIWKFGTNGPLIAKTDGVKYRIPDGPDGRFRDRLKLDNKTGSLTIMNTRTEHAGVYEVQISNSSSSSTYRFNVTVYGAATTPDLHTSSGYPSSPPLSPTSRTPSRTPSRTSSGPASGSPSGPVSQIMISAAAAAGFLLIIAVVGVICIGKKHRKPDQEVETRDEEITYADPTFYKRNTQKTGVKEDDEVIYAGIVTRR